MTNTTLSDVDLQAVTGGMRWQDFRRSTNVEDRRTPAAKAADQRWWDRMSEPK